MKKHEREFFFTATLMKWHKKYNKREMPWKGEKDPYKIWLSEIILQQTRVEQGLQYYNRFIKSYPNVLALAAAPDNEVFKLWEGLGYYNRCKNLLHAARYIVAELDGKFPESFEELLALKGVGNYTASAVASFAYNLPHAVVDGNVNRVLARYFGLATPIDSTGGKQLFANLASKLLDAKRSAQYNQAIMDFGATICKPQLPLCESCLLQDQCTAYQQDRVQELPVKEKKIAKIHRWFYYIIAEKNNSYLVRKRTGKDIWQNLHEFFLIEANHHSNTEAILESAAFKEMGGDKYKLLTVSGVYKQQLTHQTIHAIFIGIKMKHSRVPEGMQLIPKDELQKLAFPRLINTFLEQEYSLQTVPV